MKNKLTIACLLICFNCHSQKLFNKYSWVVYGADFISGASEGTRENVLYHPVQLFREFPKLNRNWWDIRISYKNKYCESPYLVAFSDANHFFKATTLVSNCVAVGFSIGDLPKKHKFLFIAEKMILSYAANKIGFFTTYNLLFKNSLQ